MSETACKNCKFWATEEAEVDWEAGASGMRVCNAVRERWKITDEASSGIDRWDEDDGKNDAHDRWLAVRREALSTAKAYVQDGSEYRAELVTGPDFFCALFETQS